MICTYRVWQTEAPFLAQTILLEFTSKQLVTTGYYNYLLLLLHRVTPLTTDMVSTKVYFDWQMKINFLAQPI